MAWAPKTPGEIRDYDVDWSAYLDGDTVASSTWDVPAGLSIITTANDDTSATIRVSGGTAGESYLLANTITTAAGLAYETSRVLDVVEESAAIPAFKERFPEFDAVSDALIGAAIAEAELAVGDRWPAEAVDIARRFYAAHILASEGEPDRSLEIATAAAAGDTAQHSVKDVSSVRIGDTAWTYGNTNAGGSGSTATAGDLESSRYGRRFLDIRSRYFVGVTTV